MHCQACSKCAAQQLHTGWPLFNHLVLTELCRAGPFQPPTLDTTWPAPIFGGSTGGLLWKAQVRCPPPCHPLLQHVPACSPQPLLGSVSPVSPRRRMPGQAFCLWGPASSEQ